MKPVRIVQIFLGLILIVSGIAKVIDPEKAISLMVSFNILPGFLIMIIMAVLPVAEIGTGCMLVCRLYEAWADAGACVLFFGFFLVSVYGTLLGLNSDCGCFGSVMESRFGWGMVVRNGVFLGMSLYASVPVFMAIFLKRKSSADEYLAN